MDRNHVNFNLSTNVSETDMRDMIPTVLERMEGYLLNERLVEKSVNSLMKLAKEEWLKYLKIYII